MNKLNVSQSENPNEVRVSERGGKWEGGGNKFGVDVGCMSCRDVVVV